MARMNGLERLSISFPATLLLTGSAMAGPAAHHLGGGGALDISLTRIVSALLLCLMIAALAALLLKRGGERLDLSGLRKFAIKLPAQRRIEPIEARRISQYADLCLVRCDDREFLILSSAQQQVVLRETPAATPPAEPAS